MYVNGLRSLGYKKGDRIPLCMKMSPKFIYMFLARWPNANPTAKRQPMNLSKQLTGLKLTSMSEEQTIFEATIYGSTGENRTIT